MKMQLRMMKKHLGEFVEWDVPIAVHCRQLDDFEDFLDTFIEQVIEVGCATAPSCRA